MSLLHLLLHRRRAPPTQPCAGMNERRLAQTTLSADVTDERLDGCHTPTLELSQGETTTPTRRVSGAQTHYAVGLGPFGYLLPQVTKGAGRLFLPGKEDFWTLAAPLISTRPRDA